MNGAVDGRETVESEYYEFMGFDPDNARSVLAHYPQFFHAGPVLELASGPGMFLDLLREAGVQARGVDLDDGMVEQSRLRGHEVELGDAIEYLRALPDDSLGGLFAAHFLEHLAAPDVQDLYVEAARVLCEGGVFVAVVPNAACLSVLTVDFWRDPTHVRFYDPGLLQFFARRAGLTVVESAGNPRNHPGAPPGVAPAERGPVPDIAGTVGEVVLQARGELEAAAGRRFGPDDPLGAATGEVVARIGHLLAVLDRGVQQLSEQVAALRASNAALVAQLYPPNEVYVVARKGEAG